MLIINRLNYIISYMENPSLDYLSRDEDFLTTYRNLIKASAVLDKSSIHAREVSIALRLLNNKLVLRVAKKINVGKILSEIISDLLATNKGSYKRVQKSCANF